MKIGNEQFDLIVVDYNLPEKKEPSSLLSWESLKATQKSNAY